ncbi:MAG: bifunctional diguanylate cyclase/phosphodiesterase [Hyphomicrobiales bacterium]
MKNRKFLTLGLICLAVVLSGLVIVTLLNLSINRALTNDAERTAVNWSKHIAHHIPSLGKREPHAGLGNVENALRKKQLARLALDIVKTSDLFQIDFVNSDCYCSISLGSYTEKQRGQKRGELSKISIKRNHLNTKPNYNHKHNAFKQTASSLPSHVTNRALKHIFTSMKSHQPRHFQGKGLHQLSLDWHKSAYAATKSSPTIYLTEDGGNFTPNNFAEVYYPVEVNGEVVYLIRALVNLQAQAASYKLYHYGGFILVLTLLFTFFAVPARNYWKARQENIKIAKRATYFETYDPLTKKLNRKAMYDAAKNQLKSADSDKSSWVLTLVELNNLSDINDISSYTFGDKVLHEMASVLDSELGKDSLIGRISGATFAILMPHHRFERKLSALVPKLKRGLKLEIENREVLVQLNSGSAQYPEHADSFDNLLRNAALTLKQTHEIGINIHRTFTPDFASAHRARATLKRSFKNAILKKQIIPHYQPIINAETGQLVGLEALARWMHPSKGVLSPASFYTALEDPEISALLGKEMIKLVTGHMGYWKAEKVPFGYVGVNINDGDLDRNSFVLETAKAMADNGLHGPNLSLEVSENCIFGEKRDDYFEKLTLLKNAGCRIALDDFGTGYSSISQLKQVPFDTVKIDRSFIIDIDSNEKDQAIVKAMTDMSRSMKFKLIAEGVETDEQLARTKELGISLIQGFLFSEPMPMSEVASFIKTAQRSAIPVKMVG